MEMFFIGYSNAWNKIGKMFAYHVTFTEPSTQNEQIIDEITRLFRMLY